MMCLNEDGFHLRPIKPSRKGHTRMPRGSKPKVPPSAMAESIVRNRGQLEVVADELGLTVRAIYNYRDRYPVVKDALEETRERTYEVVKRRLLDLIDEGNVAATIFWLKTQGRDKGWSERYELTGPNGAAIQHEHRGVVLHGSVSHIAEVYDTLAAMGAIGPTALLADGTGDPAEDDPLHSADAYSEATSFSVIDV